MQPQIRQINEGYSICEHKLLGKGSTGNVYLGFLSQHPDRKVAIKSIDLSTINNQVTRYLLSCEIAALSNLGKVEHSGHDNIVKMIEVVTERNHLYIVMELLQGGTLADYIKQHPNGLPEDEALHIFKQIIEGYQHIKSRQIVHRDLKPDNILFKRHPSQSKQVAIIDFGYCEMEEVPNKPQVFYNVGSPKYMSPEAYKDNAYSQKSDIWAIGVMLYEMLVGYTCDKGMTMQAYLYMLERKGVPMPSKARMFHQHLLSSMLQFNHKRRVGCDHLLRELHLNGATLQKQKSVIELRNTMNNGDNQPSTGRNRQVLFHSVIIPPQKGIAHEKNAIVERGLRSQAKIKQVNQNIVKTSPSKNERSNGFSFHVQHQKLPEGQILGKVQNVELPSAKQIVHPRQLMIPESKAKGHQQPQQLIRQVKEMRKSKQMDRPQQIHFNKNHPQQQNHPQNHHLQAPSQQYNQPQPMQVGPPSTPIPHQNNPPFFFHSRRQQNAPVANQSFKTPTQNNQVMKPPSPGPFPQNTNQAHIVRRQNFQNQHFLPASSQAPQIMRNGRPPQVKVMQPPSPSNYQVVHKIDDTPPIPDAKMMVPEPRLSQNRHSMQELSPGRRFKVTVSNPPIPQTKQQFAPKQGNVLISQVNTSPNQRPQVQRRPFNTQINKFFQASPQIMNIKSQDNGKQHMRLIPQNLCQLEGRNISNHAQPQIAVIKQSMIK